MTSTVGVDVGGSTVRIALVEADGAIIAQERHTLTDKTPEGVLDTVAKACEALGAAPNAPLGFGLAAQLRINEGVVAVSPNLHWREVPFGALAEERLGRKIRLVNDLNAITVGEARCGAGQGAQNVASVFLGTGLGMGAVVHGRLLEGADGLATELGHVKVESPTYGRLCGCGERGCVEAYVSGFHLPDLFAAKIATGISNPHPGNEGVVDAGTIEEGAQQGDRAARELWNDVAGYLGRVVGNMITILNPEVVVLGGGVLQRAPTLVEATIERTKQYAMRSALANLSIRRSGLADRAGLVGAGLLAHELLLTP